MKDRGWIQLEAAAPNGLIVDYRANLQYLRSIFPCSLAASASIPAAGEDQ